MEERDGVIERRRGEIARWKWMAAGLLSIVMFLLGAFAGDTIATVRFAGLSNTVAEHIAEEGHPVMVERMNALEEENKEAHIRIERLLSDMNTKFSAKLERQSMVLRQIEHGVIEANGMK